MTITTKEIYGFLGLSSSLICFLKSSTQIPNKFIALAIKFVIALAIK